MALPDAPNRDLELTGPHDDVVNEAAAKTTPNLRHETKTDNGKVFEVDFTHQYDDSSASLSDSEKERDEAAARTQATQRGLVPTGAVKLARTEKLDGRNVRFVYQVPVELNGPDATSGVAVAEQPDDTPADLAEKLDKGKATAARQPATETHGEKEK